LKKLNDDEGITIIIVTHESDVANYCKRIIRMRDGRIEGDNQTRTSHPPARLKAQSSETDTSSAPNQESLASRKSGSPNHSTELAEIRAGDRGVPLAT